MPDYVGSREHLDTLNRLWHLAYGTLALARVDPAPNTRASTSAGPLRFVDMPLHDYSTLPCPCAKCQRRPA